MDKFKKGDITYHKATFKRLVIQGFNSRSGVIVTTEDDQTKVYQPEELWTEEEWNQRNQNLAD